VTEEWRPVVGYERLYEVSSLGRVRSLPRNGTPGGVRKLSAGANGYLALVLFDGRRRHLAVHGLVARAFHGPPEPGQECRHLNGDPTDNRAENLAWGTSLENKADMVAHGRTNARVEKCPSGHEYDENNTYWYQGRRYCRACGRERSRRYQRARRASGRAEADRRTDRAL
jgi:hypothetical protein